MKRILSGKLSLPVVKGIHVGPTPGTLCEKDAVILEERDYDAQGIHKVCLLLFLHDYNLNCLNNTG